MIFVKNIFYVITLSATLPIIFAEEGSGQYDPSSSSPNGSPQNSEEGPHNEKASMFDQIPFFGPLASQFAHSLPNFPNLMGQGLSGAFGQNSQGFRPSSTFQNGEASQPSNAFDGANDYYGAGESSGFGLGFGGNRKSEADALENEPSEDESEVNENHGRLFFSTLFNTRLVTCNYTTQAGRTCTSCRQALHCFPSNVGTSKTCRGFFPYCNNGRCSIFPGAQCNSAATTTVATTSATDSTTTTG